MNVLVIGNGAREHAICWKIKKSPLLKKLYTIGYNSAFATFSENVAIDASDFQSVVKLCKEKEIDLVIVGPEDPLSKGISDYLVANGIKVFGPRLKGAVLESSKQIAKEFMFRNYIPTAGFKIFYDSSYAKEYIRKLNNFPIVIKADGLCRGKGVRIAKTCEEAFEAVEDFMERRIFGSSGMKIIVEDYLKGKECSVMCMVDGKRYLMLPISQDYKRLKDNNEGPNTGGMGSYAPLNLSKETLREIEEDVIWRFMEAIIKERIDYRGVIYFGLMLTDKGPYVLEFNVRFGDPETQSIMGLIDDDLLELFYEVSIGEIKRTSIKTNNLKGLCVVIASSGYPDKIVKGDEIIGMDKVDDDLVIFYAGVRVESGKYYTDGGRVLNLVCYGNDFSLMREKVYGNIGKIRFSGMQYRKDIAYGVE